MPTMIALFQQTHRPHRHKTRTKTWYTTTHKKLKLMVQTEKPHRLRMVFIYFPLAVQLDSTWVFHNNWVPVIVVQKVQHDLYETHTHGSFVKLYFWSAIFLRNSKYAQLLLWIFINDWLRQKTCSFDAISHLTSYPIIIWQSFDLEFSAWLSMLGNPE